LQSEVAGQPWGKVAGTFFTRRKKDDHVEMGADSKGQMKTRVGAACLSLLVGALLMGVKFYLYRVTHSSAILSDALESIINVVASGFALVSVLVASKPPDESHPYGHGKIEYFSAGFEGALILFAAVGIFVSGIPRIMNPGDLPNLRGSLLILFGVSLVNLGLGFVLIRTGKRTSSLTLTADGKHVITDVYTSGGVLVGLWLAHLTGWYRLDGIIACLVGVNILFSGWSLVRQSFTGLMDASDPRLLKRIADLIASHRREAWIDIHQLRAWRSGNFIHVDLHLILPRDFSLEESHREAMILENSIVNHFQGRASVLIHTDPCIDPDCPICRKEICGSRKAERTVEDTWSVASFIASGERRGRMREG
jgi:cation diffusion facilitator family transporter